MHLNWDDVSSNPLLHKKKNMMKSFTKTWINNWLSIANAKPNSNSYKLKVLTTIHFVKKLLTDCTGKQ